MSILQIPVLRPSTPKRRVVVPSIIITGAMLAAPGTYSPGVPRELEMVLMGSQTVAPQLLTHEAGDSQHSRARRPTVASAQAVLDLRAESGLTWDQLGRLFGVSRRAVHLWASGKRMNSRNIELLGTLRTIVDGAPVKDPDSRRMWLFAPDRDGRSPIGRFMSEYRAPGEPLRSHGYTAAGLLDIDTEGDGRGQI